MINFNKNISAVWNANSLVQDWTRKAQFIFHDVNRYTMNALLYEYTHEHAYTTTHKH